MTFTLKVETHPKFSLLHMARDKEKKNRVKIRIMGRNNRAK